MDLTTKIDLLPDIFDKSSSPSSYIRKKFEVIADIFQEIIDTTDQLTLLNKIQDYLGDGLNFSASIDLQAQSYGLMRNGLSDNALVSLILAKQMNQISGDEYDKILLYLTENFGITAKILEMWSDEWAGFLGGSRLYRMFDVEAGIISDDTKTLIRTGVNVMRAAGIRSEINWYKYLLSFSAWTGYTAAAAKAWTAITYQPISGRYIAVDANDADTGQVMYSSDNGQTWTAVNAAEQNAWTGIAASNSASLNYVVAVASSGTNRFMRSTDGGSTWTAITSPAQRVFSAVSCSGIAGGAGVFVAIAFSTNKASRSTDGGATWTEPFTLPQSALWSALTPGGASASDFMIVSVEGYIANTQLPATNYASGIRLLSIASDGGSHFVAVGDDASNQVAISKDSGVTWKLVPGPKITVSINNGWNSITYVQGEFIAVGGGTLANKVMRSLDNGETWVVEDAAANNNWTSIVAGASRTLVAISNTGTNQVQVWNSGLDVWESKAIVANDFAVTGSYGEGLFLIYIKRTAGAIKGFARSTDFGLTFTFYQTGIGALSSNVIEFRGGHIWAEDGGATDKRIYMSGFYQTFEEETALGSWNPIYTDALLSGVALHGTWRSFAYIHSTDTLIGVNDDKAQHVFRLTNAYSRLKTYGAAVNQYFELVTTEDNPWKSIAASETGIAVSVASSGTHRIMRSINSGLTWSYITAPSVHTWIKVIFGQGIFIAIANDKIMRSDDMGLTWSDLSYTTSWPITDISYGDSVFILTRETGGAEPTIHKSIDKGDTWTDYSDTTDNACVIYGRGKFIVGRGGSSSEILRNEFYDLPAIH